MTIPRWPWTGRLSTDRRELILNALSLACGFAGNVFLLLSFTKRLRYIIALPLSIVSWLLSSVLVIPFATCLQPRWKVAAYG